MKYFRNAKYFFNGQNRSFSSKFLKVTLFLPAIHAKNAKCEQFADECQDFRDLFLTPEEFAKTDISLPKTIFGLYGVLEEKGLMGFVGLLRKKEFGALKTWGIRFALDLLRFFLGSYLLYKLYYAL